MAFALAPFGVSAKSQARLAVANGFIFASHPSSYSGKKDDFPPTNNLRNHETLYF
jgi:hypothetical protein